jgi:hypothetical protein
MATTLSLNNNSSVWVTTFYGGEYKGTCFTITKQCGDSQVSRTFTMTDLENMLFREGGTVSGLVKPDFDNGRDPLRLMGDVEQLNVIDKMIETRQAEQKKVFQPNER